MSENDTLVFKNLPETKPCDFILSVDTYDKPICAYALYKITVGEIPECITTKTMNDYESFVEEVKNLQKYFNAKQVGFFIITDNGLRIGDVANFENKCST